MNVSILCESSSGKFESFCKSLQKSYLIIQLMITLVKPKIHCFFFFNLIFYLDLKISTDVEMKATSLR